MKTRILLASIALCATFNAIAQKNVFLTVKHKIGANNFAFNQAASNNLSNNLSITRIDYYMSNFTIIHDGGLTLALPDNTIVLAKGNNNVNVNLGNFDVTNVEGITFSVGVPQSLNHTDPTLYASTNPLAPQSPSMQWGWTSGYRFVAIEGMAGASLNTIYQMHSLGDANFFSQTKMVVGINTGNDIVINLDADYTQALKDINVTIGPIDHGVNATDLTVLQNFRDFVFSPGTGLTGLTSTSTSQEISIYPNPNNGNFIISNTAKNNQITNVFVYDMTGKEVLNQAFQNQNNFEINLKVSGIYMLAMQVDGIPKYFQKIIVQ